MSWSAQVELVEFGVEVLPADLQPLLSGMAQRNTKQMVVVVRMDGRVMDRQVAPVEVAEWAATLIPMASKADPALLKFVQQDSRHLDRFLQIRSLVLPLTTAAAVVVVWEITTKMLEPHILVQQVVELPVDAVRTSNWQSMA